MYSKHKTLQFHFFFFFFPGKRFPTHFWAVTHQLRTTALDDGCPFLKRLGSYHLLPINPLNCGMLQTGVSGVLNNCHSLLLLICQLVWILAVFPTHAVFIQDLLTRWSALTLLFPLLLIIHALQTEREAPWCYTPPVKTLIVMWPALLNVVLFRPAVFFGQLSKTFTFEAESQYCSRERETERIRSIKVDKYSSTVWCRQTLKAILKKVSWFFVDHILFLISILYSGPTSGIRV